MSEIKPFKAVYFNPDKVKNIADVVCPPYDVISPEQQKDFYNKNDHNYIRILLGKTKPKDDGQN